MKFPRLIPSLTAASISLPSNRFWWYWAAVARGRWVLDLFWSVLTCNSSFILWFRLPIAFGRRIGRQLSDLISPVVSSFLFDKKEVACGKFVYSLFSSELLLLTILVFHFVCTNKGKGVFQYVCFSSYSVFNFNIFFYLSAPLSTDATQQNWCEVEEVIGGLGLAVRAQGGPFFDVGVALGAGLMCGLALGSSGGR